MRPLSGLAAKRLRKRSVKENGVKENGIKENGVKVSGGRRGEKHGGKDTYGFGFTGSL